jgi:hypothetical protein
MHSLRTSSWWEVCIDKGCNHVYACAAAPLQVFRSYVFKRPAFIEYFNLATPVGELGRLNIGAHGTHAVNHVIVHMTCLASLHCVVLTKRVLSTRLRASG